VSGIKTIRYMHQTIQQSRRPSTDNNGVPILRVWENEQRQDMIEAARKVEVNFSVQMVYNQERKLVHVVAGDVVRAHHRAARYAVNHLATEYATDADVLVVNAYPKGSQLHEHFGWGSRGLKPGGSIVVINQNPMGEFVWHYLDEAQFNQGGSYFAQRDARRRPVLSDLHAGHLDRAAFAFDDDNPRFGDVVVDSVAVQVPADGLARGDAHILVQDGAAHPGAPPDVHVVEQD
jgi:hypothetical protein